MVIQCESRALFFPIKQKNLKGKQSKFSHTLLSVIIFMSKGLLIGLIKVIKMSSV